MENTHNLILPRINLVGIGAIKDLSTQLLDYKLSKVLIVTDQNMKTLGYVEMIEKINFRKLFKEFTGIAPATYQQELRLQRAKELLSTTDFSIKEIAYRLRFETPDYFSSKFKVKTGCKPSEFRHRTR